MKTKFTILLIFTCLFSQAQFSAARKLLLAQTFTPSVECGWNLDSITYVDGIDYTNKYAGSYQISLEFNEAYSKAYFLIQEHGSIHQYNLSTAKDISTATHYDTLDISANTSIPMGLDFSSDGYYMYVLDYVGNRIEQYNLSTAYDITTATHSGKYFSLTQANIANNFTISEDFNKLYVFSDEGSSVFNIYQYSLTSESDISLLSYDNKYLSLNSIGGVQTTDIDIKRNGEYLYISKGDIYEYNLNTAYDITTATLSNTVYAGNTYYSFLFADKNTGFSITQATGEIAQYYFDCGSSYSSLACPEIINVASTGTFQMAHSLITDGTYIYVGERINNATPTEIARIIKYNASTLAEVSSYSVGANRDVESMVYNSTDGAIYFSMWNYSDASITIGSLNPSTMALIDTTNYSTLSGSGQSYPLVTDGTYLYGATYKDPATFFKIRLSDMALVATNEWTSGERAHAARIDVENGYMYVTDIPYSAGTDVRFAKVSLSDLSYSEVNIGAYVRKATDDFAMVKSGGETYCYVGSEYVYSSGGNAGYGGVQVRTSDLSLTGISLKTTYALGEAGNVVYSTTLDGNIQVFDISDLNTVTTCNLGGYFGNEFIRLGIYGYITNFNAYNEADGKLIRISLTE